jgi:predicted deacylase
MKYIQTTYPIQHLPAGATHEVCAYTFQGSLEGPSIYMQANLHGPEVFGTALLLEIIEHLKVADDIVGSITIVPVANPMGVSSVAHNAIVGRWNQTNGVNWNRIFPKHVEWKNHQEEVLYFKEILQKQGISVQDKLAATLRSLSVGSDYVIDIHCTGTHNLPHLFCREDMSEEFVALGAMVHLVSDKETAEETFEESHVYPFRNHMAYEDIPKACTWEVSGYGTIDKKELAERKEQLLCWLEGVWGGNTADGVEIKKFSHFGNLKSERAGYYVWNAKVGDVLAKGDTYATVYDPHTLQKHVLRASYTCMLLSTYGIGALSEGEDLAWVGWN